MRLLAGLYFHSLAPGQGHSPIGGTALALQCMQTSYRALPRVWSTATVLSACFSSKTGLQTPLFTGIGAAMPFSSCVCPQQIWSLDLAERSQSKHSELGVYFQSDSCDLVALLPIKDEQFLQQTTFLPLWKSKQGVIFCSTNPSSFEMSWAFKA